MKQKTIKETIKDIGKGIEAWWWTLMLVGCPYDIIIAFNSDIAINSQDFVILIMEVIMLYWTLNYWIKRIKK